MEKLLSCLEDYDVSEALGFLPSSLLSSLPCPYYSPWELAAAKLRDLPEGVTIKEEILCMPLLETRNLVNEDAWRRAYVILGYLSNAFLFSSTPPEKILPLCLAQPMLDVSMHLGLPPVPTYSGQTLWNHPVPGSTDNCNTSENPNRPISFTGSAEEAAFFSISVAIESCGAPLIPALLSGMQAAACEDPATLISCLADAERTLNNMTSLLPTLFRNCSPDFFYFTLRPYLEGTGDLQSVGMPDGIFYEKVSGGAFQRYRGPSNAQSALFVFTDIALGVKHHGTATGSAANPGLLAAKAKFLTEMRDYMPRGHRRFLAAVEREQDICSYVRTQQHNHCLFRSYTACLDALTRFRGLHIQMVTRYVVIPAKKGRAMVETSSLPISIAGANGTGGTRPIEFLKSVRDDVVYATKGREWKLA